MYKLPITFLVTIMAVTNAIAQMREADVLDAITHNNTTLVALRADLSAERANNKTGLTLPNPEVEFAYLWGASADMGGRKDIKVTQSFDLATLSGARRDVAVAADLRALYDYRRELMAIRIEARQTLVRIVHANALCLLLQERVERAQAQHEAQDKRLKRGDGTKIETGRTKLTLTAAQGALRQADIERRALLGELQRLNGGTAIEVTDTVFAPDCLLPDFDQWYSDAAAHNPILAYAAAECNLGQKQVRLTKAEGLPDVRVGYTSELVPGEEYRGVAVGLSIPLWQNKGRVRQARASLQASEARYADARVRFRTKLATLYENAKAYASLASDYRQALDEYTSPVLLSRALEAGEISLIDYLNGTDLYYDHRIALLDAERDHRLIMAELSSMAEKLE